MAPLSAATTEDMLSEENGLLSTRAHPLSRSPSPFARRQQRRKIAGHKGQAGFGSSVINISNTILGSTLVARVVAY